jgi:Gas vesicle synthesis protein GvpL/GvpF
MTSLTNGLGVMTDEDELTGLYVYAIVADEPDRIPGSLVGLDGSPVELVRHEDVAAAVGIIAIDRPPGRRRDLMSHSEVLDALDASGPVVPVQFGTVLPDRDAVVGEVLDPDVARWRALLEALSGRRQLNLRATYNEAAVLQEIVAENPDVAELRERTRGLPEEVGHPERIRLGELVARAVDVKREDDTAMVMEPVLPHVVSYAPRHGTGIDHLLDVAFLVDDHRRQSFEDTLESLAEAWHERIHFQLVGPVPPYDFVEGDWWA